MRLTIAAVGRLRAPGMEAAFDEYARRLVRYGRFEHVEVREGGGESAAARDAEAGALLRATERADVRVVLDERGRLSDSHAFASLLGEWADRGRPHIAFAIGGASGLGAALRDAADHTLSLSPMTLPHEMARVVLVEQLYRACTIRRGEPYHK
jgi:23S rRNA (pseudouridine1915-N3)-methyltransferase